MERATKLVVLAWVGAALAFDIWLLRGAWPRLVLIAPVGIALTAALAAVDRRAVALVLAIGYVFPALTYRYVGSYSPLYTVLWLALLVGAMLPDATRTSWHVPARWRGALIGWALTVMLGASLVAAREIDFTLSLLPATTIANTAGGGWPAFFVRWVLHVALVVLVGILWFDWLFGMPDDQFHIGIATPMAVSFFALAAVAGYQLFADVYFLNPTVFGNQGRASGSVFDANVCGAIAAFWIGGVQLWANNLGRWRPYACASGIAAGWLAVWASGSRTAFAAAMIVTAFSVAAVYAARRGKSRLRAFAAAALAVAGAVGLLAWLASAPLSVAGPIARLMPAFSTVSADSMGGAIKEELWNRNGYGAASTAMIRRYPYFGVGVGSFQLLLPEFSFAAGRPLPPDNAQNWYRHQLAELGIVGSVAWIVWVFGFGAYVLRTHAAPAPQVLIGRGVLVAFAAVSFVGMPGQDALVAMTFWTMAAWHVRLDGPPRPVSIKPWPLVIVLSLVYVAGTAHAAATSLRVPVRAQRGGWPYSHGLYSDLGESDRDQGRWTGRRAVAVVKGSGEWMAVTVSVDYRRIGRETASVPLAHSAVRPVDARVWRNGELILQQRLTTTAPVTKYVRVAGGEQWILLETWVSRVLRPRDFGVPDDRELGMKIQWRFADRPGSATGM
jgi:hypothetical protein